MASGAATATATAAAVLTGRRGGLQSEIEIESRKFSESCLPL